MLDSEATFDSPRAGARFLLADLDLAMTFLDLANTSQIKENVRRNRQNAHTAYDAVCHLLPRLVLTAVEWRCIQRKLLEATTRLEAAGGQL